MKTFSPNAASITPDWYVINASGKTLGRLATRIATILMGKHKPVYAPHVAGGDFVVVVNAEQIVLTGKKASTKIYYQHSGYHGGLKSISAEKLMGKDPALVLRKAVKGMLPKNNLGRRMLGHCKIYAGSEHPHEAQQPKPLEL